MQKYKKTTNYTNYTNNISYFCTMNNTKRRMLAEWEPQSAVQLTWPHKDTDWAPILPEITAVYEEMAREIKKR